MSLKIAIHGKPFTGDTKSLMEQLWSNILSKNCDITLSDSFKTHLLSHDFEVDHIPAYSSLMGPQGVDMAWSIGGDGTLLETLTHIGDKMIPILGINTGRLGFLATISPQEVSQALDFLIQGNFRVEERSLVSVKSEVDLFANQSFGLNEVGIMKTDTSSMIVIKAYVDGNYLNSYWADGLIVSTATGSTGYSLSVGGPLVMPGSDIFIIAPMSPHNLNVRPLVVSSDSQLRFEVSSRSQNFLISIDSRSKVLDSQFSIEVQKAVFPAKLIKIPGDDFLQTLRNKLNWGLDVRN
ncbi:NAD kinase [Aquirufa rosea]|uniref:NAD kinase n=1 Tax=Aquirufa rosea TaxID=2509241 RepID=A0A4Q1C0B1_9BACT|nr:NAD kinase [Aquirufa rosea]RXK49835.1 NAD kinase [Aquirufa rosea]